MLGRILVGLDGSYNSRSVVELGLRWAQQYRATLTGIGVVDEPDIRALEPAGPVGGQPGVHPVYRLGYEAQLAEQRRKIERQLAEFAARCTAAGVAFAVLEEVGLPHEQILHEAKGYDIILLGQHAHFRFSAREDAADSTIRRVLRHTPSPVVVAPETLTEGRATVIAFDGSLQAARALESFEALGLGREGPVHVVSVAASPAAAAELADRALESLRAHRVEATPHARGSWADPAEAILDVTRQVGAGLIVIGAYGQPVMREFFLGSATRTLLDESPVPLFLYH